MEQVGASGLPPLLPAVPVPVAVAVGDSDQAVEQDLCSLTELVPVRSQQPTTASDRILASDVPREETSSKISGSGSESGESPVGGATPSLNTETEPSEPSTPASSAVEEIEVRREVSPGTPTFQVPPHLLGRTVENPAADIPPGRRMQKPRLGVRVPYRNLTSQIVTQNEIAQEIFERAQKKHPYVENIPEAAVPGRITTSDLFTRKLTQRLASSISPQATKPKIAAVPESIGTLKALLPNKTASLVEGVRLSPGFTYSEKEKAALDDAELLSILEGDGEPLWLPDKLLKKVEGAPSNPSTPFTLPPGTPSTPGLGSTPAQASTPPPAQVLGTPSTPPNPSNPAPATPQVQHQPLQPSPPKLDPALEKELALKQLEELPIKFPPKKPDKKDKPPTVRKRKVQVKKEVIEEPEVSTEAQTVLDSTLSVNSEVAPVIAGTEVVAGEVTGQAIVEPGTPVNGVAVAEGTSSTTMPAKKPPSTRKRKLLPDVAAVLKKPKLSKKVEAVANGKVKATKKPTTSVTKKKGEKSSSVKKVPLVKVEPETVVTNGNVGAANKKVVVKKVAKGKSVPATPKKSTPKTPPGKAPASNKTAKTTPKTANKTPVPVQLVKIQKGMEEENEESVDDPQKETEEMIANEKAEKEQEVPPTIEANVIETKDVEMVEESASNNQKAAEPQSVPSVSQPHPVQQQKKSKISRELEFLLGDEGAVNMLYAVEGQGNKRKTSSQDLALKARLVKTAVMRLSTGPQGHVPLALRARRSLNVTEPPKLVKMGTKRKQRQLSSESHDSMRSPPYLTPVDSHVYSPRQKLTADASRIIRRHSSSSTFSSPSVSPRRGSVEDNKDDITSAAATSGTQGTPARKKGIPIFVRDAAKNATYSGKKKSKVMNPVALDSALTLSESARKLLEMQCDEVKAKKPTLLPNPAALKKKDLKMISSEVKKKVKSEMFKNFKKGLDSATAIVTKKAAKLQKAQMLAEKKAAEEMAKAKKAGEELVDAQREIEELSRARVVDGRSITPPPVLRAAQHIKREGGRSAAPLSPDATSYSNLLKSLDQKGKRLQVEDRQRATARHCAGTYNYRELSVRRYDNVVHIILAPVSTKMRCALNIQVLRELRDALQQVRKDDSCHVVLLTSSGAAFCLGVDVATLLHSHVDKRKTAAIELTLALKDFMKCVASYPKPLVAGVNGAAVGLGVTMLPLFDMVFASDKATFHTPYAQLGQVPEGGATLTLPYMLGHTATSELLLNCRKLTANEALQCGLVTRILWPDKFLEELVPVVKKIAAQSAQSMEATKALLRHGLRTKFDAALESETHLLVTHWTSQECQNHFRRWVEEDQLGTQPQQAVADT